MRAIGILARIPARLDADMRDLQYRTGKQARLPLRFAVVGTVARGISSSRIRVLRSRAPTTAVDVAERQGRHSTPSGFDPVRLARWLDLVRGLASPQPDWTTIFVDAGAQRKRRPGALVRE